MVNHLFNCYTPTAPRNTNQQAFRARQSRDVPWVAAAKAGSPDVRPERQTCVEATLQQILAPWSVAEGTHKNGAH